MKIFAVLLFLLSSSVAAQCAHPQQDGTFIFTDDTAADCSGYWLITAGQYNAYLSAVEISVADVTSAFTWGFGIVVFLSYLAFKVRIGTQIVRKI